MAWVQPMNGIRTGAAEIVREELMFHVRTEVNGLDSKTIQAKESHN